MITIKFRVRRQSDGKILGYEWVDDIGQWRHQWAGRFSPCPIEKDILMGALPAPGIREQWSTLLDKNEREIYDRDSIIVFGLIDRVICKNGIFGYPNGTGIISLAGNHNFEWKNGKSDEIEVIEEGGK